MIKCYINIPVTIVAIVIPTTTIILASASANSHKDTVSRENIRERYCVVCYNLYLTRNETGTKRRFVRSGDGSTNAKKSYLGTYTHKKLQ